MGIQGINADDAVKFNKDGLIPVIAQDNASGEVLMLAWMNREALDKTVATGLAHYWSRSRDCLWQKGETSGNIQKVISMHLDCDSDTLLLKVEQKGCACHTGNRNCFFTELSAGKKAHGSMDKGTGTAKYGSAADNEHGIMLGDILDDLYNVICGRIKEPKEGSYTNYLLEKGLDKILKKVGEESAEVIIASKNKSRHEIVYEIADLLYHLLVLMADGGIVPGEIAAELQSRRK